VFILVVRDKLEYAAFDKGGDLSLGGFFKGRAERSDFSFGAELFG
jgi:hypothetical protein